MLAKKFAFGVGIAIILPMMIYYGVSVFSPKVRWEDYQIEGSQRLYDQTTSEAEKAQIREQQKKMEAKRQRDTNRFETHLFYTAVPVGIIAIIAGSVMAVQAVGAGLIFGGIFSVTQGYACYWSELSDVMRFLSLLIVFFLLIFMGYRKFTERKTA